MKNFYKWNLILVLAAITTLLTGCQTAPAPTAVPSPTATIASTSTVAPSPTQPPTPTVTATAIPVTPVYEGNLSYNPETRVLSNPQGTPVFTLSDDGAWEEVVPELPENLTAKEKTQLSEVDWRFNSARDEILVDGEAWLRLNPEKGKWENVYYQEGGIEFSPLELYGGRVELNPEKAEAFREGILEGLYEMNQVVENNDFTSKYPTLDSFIKAAEQGVVFTNIKLPEPDYFNDDPMRPGVRMMPVSANGVILKEPRIIIPEIPTEFISGGFGRGSGYIVHAGQGGAFKMETRIVSENLDGPLRITLYLSKKVKNARDFYGILPLTPDMEKEEQVLSINELVNTFFGFIRLIPEAIKEETRPGPMSNENHLIVAGPSFVSGTIYLSPEEFVYIFSHPEILKNPSHEITKKIPEYWLKKIKEAFIEDVFIARE